MMAKKHEHSMGSVLAVCDKDLLGKTFEEGNICFTVSEKFYGGKEVTEKELLEMWEESSSINMFGNKCVGIMQKKGLVGEKALLIKGIKHIQAYKL